MALEQIKHKRAHLVFLASDALQNTTKRITDKSEFYQVKLNHDFTTDELNQAIGTLNRKVIAVTDKSFATMMIRELEQ